MDSYYQTAFDLMRSERAKKAFNIAEEPAKLREKYGRTSLGKERSWRAAWWNPGSVS